MRYAYLLGLIVASLAIASCTADPTLIPTGTGGGKATSSGTMGGNGPVSGSTTNGFMTDGATSTAGTTCPGQITCASAGLNCGTVGDGCGGTLDCGTCSNNEVCGGGGTPNVCGTPACTKKTCADLGFNCGMTSDGCNGTLDCGTCMNGQVCGSTAPNVCGDTVCTPTSCTDLGFNCGMQGDGCGNTQNCGTCGAGLSCGGGGVSGQCGMPACTPKDCASQGFNCGMATDGCNGIIDCGPTSCGGGNQVCGGSMPNVCGTSANCTGLCLQQQTCPNGKTTTVSGKVFAPQGTDPLYNTLVYVPNGGPAPTYGVMPFAPGVHCGQCGADVSGSPLVSDVTAIDGTFKLTNVPVGNNIPIVIQNGRWRRQFVIPTVTACVDNPIPSSGAQQLRMPRTKAEGDIPLMGFVTGSVDALECVLRKIGIADSEFTNPSGNGRVRMYLGDNSAYGAQINASTPDESQLWGNQNTINQYDMVYFACKGDQYTRSAAAQTTLLNYANAGGRVFGTHYSYVWLYQNGPFATTANWSVNQPGFFQSDPETGFVNQTFQKGDALAKWLQGIGATTTVGQIPIATLRDDFTAVNANSDLWIYLNDPNYPPKKPMHYTFNTPVGQPPANQCGRVLYDDFHVEDAFTSGMTFPSECTNGTMTPQEKMLEFMIFDLGSCVTPATCAPKTCQQQNKTCGPVGDGCGNIEQCGSCPAGEFCVDGNCQGCTPKTCLQQGFMCGSQGDGCGNIEMCGTCPAGQNCVNGMCKVGTCTPKSCMQQGFTCGAQGDGCGAIEQCGTCMNNQTCTNGSCVTPMCTPKNCQQLGFDCGQASDGCNGVINCGTCTNGQTCGGGTPPQANVCGGGAS